MYGYSYTGILYINTQDLKANSYTGLFIARKIHVRIFPASKTYTGLYILISKIIMQEYFKTSQNTDTGSFRLMNKQFM